MWYSHSSIPYLCHQQQWKNGNTTVGAVVATFNMGESHGKPIKSDSNINHIVTKCLKAEKSGVDDS